MKTSLKKQQGMTMISMISIAIVVGSIFFLAISIFPIYMEHGKLTGALDSIKKNPEAKAEPPELIRNRLFKVLGINNFDAVKSEDVVIARDETGRITIHVKYEVVKKVVSNASILVEFDDTVTIE